MGYTSHPYKAIPKDMAVPFTMAKEVKTVQMSVNK